MKIPTYQTDEVTINHRQCETHHEFQVNKVMVTGICLGMRITIKGEAETGTEFFFSSSIQDLSDTEASVFKVYMETIKPILCLWVKRTNKDNWKIKELKNKNTQKKNEVPDLGKQIRDKGMC